MFLWVHNHNHQNNRTYHERNGEQQQHHKGSRGGERKYVLAGQRNPSHLGLVDAFPASLGTEVAWSPTNALLSRKSITRQHRSLSPKTTTISNLGKRGPKEGDGIQMCWEEYDRDGPKGPPTWVWSERKWEEGEGGYRIPFLYGATVRESPAHISICIRDLAAALRS